MMIDIKATIISEMEKLQEKVNKAEKKGLKKTGAYLRQEVKRSLRRSIKASSAGEPPRVHGTGKYTLKNVFFDVDINSLSTAIGYKDPVLDSIAFLHENGGPKTMSKNPPRFRINQSALFPNYKIHRAKNQKWNWVTLKKGRAKRRKIDNVLDRRAAKLFYMTYLAGHTFKYPKRPFLEPSIKKGTARALEIWRNSL